MKIMILILFIIFIFIIIYKIANGLELFDYNDLEVNILDVKTDDKILLVLKNMLNDTDKLLNKYNIAYWIDSGTLLGAVRHKDIIPWDDDADIVIYDHDLNKFLELQSEFYKMGYGIASAWCGYKIFPLNGLEIKYYNRNWKWSEDYKDIELNETFNYKYPFIDVSLVSKFDNIFHYSNEKVRRVWPNYYNNINDLFPLKKYKFNNFELWGPNNPNPYLDRAYGKDWRTIAYKQYDHENQRFLNKKKFLIKN